ncbi:hypothetical protein P3T36_002566 [Kitasatospora sp. MAP12-15]|uniref:DUF6230 family protein n=1 Tax=unclassified Kitasatospora TaxID=2633591 RepID=UPI002473F553|nr:DUF6230 family protein [Kitasatospora sp. MAP12-44]MDH6112848.1 hypothetical protein [Kitasatospora sp. MAP12-44]
MSQVFGKTRWKRFALVMVPSIAATAAIGISLADSALAASFSVSGQSFKVTTSDLKGSNFAQFGSVDVETNGTPHVVAVSAFDQATIQNLCQSVVTDLGPLGKWTLVLNAGNDAAKPVQASNLLIDLNQLNADATFTNINIGQDASTLGGTATAGWKDKMGHGLPTGAQGFAQSAEKAELSNVQQTAYATSAGTFVLNGLKLNIKQGSGAGVECY